MLTGPSFFPHLISGPFSDGLDAAFVFAIVACLVAAVASLLRGGRYHHADEPAGDQGARPHDPETGGTTCTLSGTASPPLP